VRNVLVVLFQFYFDGADAITAQRAIRFGQLLTFWWRLFDRSKKKSGNPNSPVAAAYATVTVVFVVLKKKNDRLRATLVYEPYCYGQMNDMHVNTDNQSINQSIKFYFRQKDAHRSLKN